MAAYDAIFVGSGINALSGAALLAKAGWRVCVLERNEWLGGAILTAEATAPGFRHELFSSWHPLFLGGAVWPQLEAELTERGVEYLNTELPTGTLFPDGSAAFLTTSHEGNVAELERHATGDGAAWDRAHAEFMANADLAFGVLGTELWSSAGLGLAVKAYRRLGREGLLRFSGDAVASCRDWLTDSFESERAHGLLAPWVLHTGLGPDAALSGFMTQVIAVALELGGMPVPRGGGSVLVDALAGIVRDAGGEARTGADVVEVVVGEGGARGVRLADGELVEATRAVVAGVTPTQLYGRLVDARHLPGDVVEAGRRYRYGRAGMQIHLALSEPPRWEGDERLARTAIVHLTPGLDGVSRAVNEADRGLLPAEATIVCGQPVAVDPSRAPAGSWIVWIQLQELPSRPRGDALGELDTGDGTWTEELRERYADRIVARLARQLLNAESAQVGRRVLSPADIAAANVNLVGGDIYAGSLNLDQNLMWRPRPTLPGHRTPVPRLFHIGASTHPGPGLGGGSGALVAEQLLRPPLARRVLSRVPGLGR
jgi:phytoene dehydrogenase-like protein